MCGRYTLTEPNSLHKRFGTVNTLPKEIKPNYNAAPTQTMPVIVLDAKGKSKIELMSWGINLHWMNKLVFNTRTESILKPVWKKKFSTQRCIVPATSFYEWKKTGSAKQPYLIRVKDQEIFGMAGIFEKWTEETTGEVFTSYSIVTTTPNNTMKPIHDRMPVILDPKEEKVWLDPDQDTDELIVMLNSYSDKKMELYEVSPDVGKSKNNYIELTYPLNSQ